MYANPGGSSLGSTTLTCSPSSLTIRVQSFGSTTCTVTFVGGQDPDAIFSEVSIQFLFGSCSVSQPIQINPNTTQKNTVTVSASIDSPPGTYGLHVFVKNCPLGYCPTGPIVADSIITIVVTP
jgi:hypothetical protein